MSFVDPMADHDWSEGDILAYTEQYVRGGFGVEEIPILRDKLLAQMVGTRAMTADEQADMARYEARKVDAGAMAQEARDDMVLLRQAWAVEAGTLDPATAPQPVLDLVAARAAARTPPPEPTTEPQP